MIQTKEAVLMREWLESSSRKPFVYHVGHMLAYDRKPKIAQGVWELYENGRVLLVQKRLGPDEYQYWALKAGGKRNARV